MKRAYLLKLCTYITLTCLWHNVATAQIDVDVNLNIKHSVDGVSDFGRERHMTLHASLTEGDWVGHDDMMDYLINDLDVYFGRDNGSAGWKNSQSAEDPNRPNWPDVNYQKTYGQSLKEWYESDVFASRRQYEKKSKQMIMGLTPHPNYPTLDWHSEGPGRVRKGQDDEWQVFDVKASAFWMAHYLDNHFSKNNTEIGEPLPTYWECINEADMEMYGYFEMFVTSPELLWEYHNETARVFKEVLGDKAPKIGGMTWGQHDLQSPDFVLRQKRSFYVENGDDIIKNATNSLTWDHRKDKWWQWDGLFQGFIDNCGENMDFYSIHIYDWPQLDESKSTIRSGGHTEAMLDLMEWYDMYKFGTKKEIIISEYGGVGAGIRERPLKTRDWWSLRPFNQMMMQFLERPSQLTLTMPFAPVKAQWGDEFNEDGSLKERYLVTMMDPIGEYREDTPGARYNHQNWEWSNIILFYELWSDVKGTRIDTKSSDRDIQVDAYVDGNHMYLILNNLEDEATTINLNQFNDYENAVKSVSMKHQFFDVDKNEPINKISKLGTSPGSVSLGASATMVIDYEFTNPVNIDQESKEIKFYGEPLTNETTFLGGQKCHVSVRGRRKFTTEINNVTVPTVGEATLRIGVNTFATDNIEIVINGHQLSTEEDIQDWRGQERVRTGVGWFGVIEQDVPIEFLETNNVIEITNHRQNSEYSSFILQMWDFSKAPGRSATGNGVIAVDNIDINGNDTIMQGQELPLGIDFSPSNASNQGITWTSSNPDVATVDEFGVLTAISDSGTTTITAVSKANASATASKVISAQAFSAIPVSSITINEGNNITVERFINTSLSASILPLNATDQTIEWSSSNTDIVEVTNTGKVIGKVVNETATVTASVIDTASGNTVHSSDIEVYVTIQGPELVQCWALPTQVKPFETLEVNVPIKITNTRTVVVEFKQGNTILGSGSKTITDFGDSVIDVSYNLSSPPIVGSNYSYTVKLMDGTTELSSCSSNVEVIDHTRATSVSINDGIRNVQIGDQIQLIAQILPEDTYNKALIWSSSNTEIASVDNTGIVTGVGQGDATITVTTIDGGFISSVNITSQTGVVIEEITAINLPTNVNLFPGLTTEINATLIPEWTTQTDLVWSSSDPSLATVDQNGLVTAKPTVNGTVIITATSSENASIFQTSNVLISKTIIVQAEDFVDTGGSNGGFDRYEINGEGAINFNQTGDWVDYDVDFPDTGEYLVTYYMGSPNDGAGVTLSIDGVTVNVTDVPNNGDYDDFQQIVTTSTVTIAAGTHKIRLESSGTADWQWNMERFEFRVVNTTSPDIPVTGVNIAPTSIDLNVGQSSQLTKTISPANASNQLVTWASNNTAIATVDTNGLVTAIADGSAAITVTTNDGNLTAVSTINVTANPIAVTGITVNSDTVTLQVGNTSTITESITPANATDKSVIWSSLDTSIATVNNNGLITAIAEGNTTITVTTTDGSFTASSTVTVTPVTSSGNDITLEAEDYSDMGGVNQNGTRGGKIATLGTITYMEEIINTDWLEYTFNVISAGQYEVSFVAASNRSNQNIQYTLDGTIIDTHAISQTGASTVFNTTKATTNLNLTAGSHTLRLVATGTYLQWNLDKTILSPINGNTNPIAVTGVSVSENTVTLATGATFNLNETITPVNATNTNVSWNSSDTSIATVNTNGLIAAVAEGSVTISVTTEDGNFTASTSVTITPPANNTTLVIEAETFDTTDGTYNDAFAGGPGNGVNKTAQGINYVNNGDWVEYEINVTTAGTYAIEYLISTPSENAQIELTVGPSTLTTDIPNNGEWDNYQSVNGGNIDLVAGNQTIRILASGSNTWQWNLDKIIFSSGRTNSAKNYTLNTIKNDNEQNNFIIYPNPADQLLVITGLANNKYQLNLFDTNGQLVVNKEVNFINEYTINVSSLSAGVYHLKIINSTIEWTTKLLIE